MTLRSAAIVTVLVLLFDTFAVARLFPWRPLKLSSTANHSIVTIPAESQPSHLTSHIAPTELEKALNDSLPFLQMSVEQVKQLGWSVVLSESEFAVYRRREDGSNTSTVYLTLGRLADVSPKAFFSFQVREDLRKLWDDTTKEMRRLLPIAETIPAQESDLLDGDGEDVVYVRTPMPFMKDRDYVIARRAKTFQESVQPAIVLYSRSIELPPLHSWSPPAPTDTVRDRYWSHCVITPSAPLSGPRGATGPLSLSSPGVSFVLLYSDQQNSSVSSNLRNVLSSFVIKQTRKSINKLRDIARDHQR